MIYSRSGIRTYTYWKLESAQHTDTVDETAARVRELLQDTLERQLVSDVPVCSLLSGGLDSSALTALAVDYYNRTGQGRVDTFSVDYVDNDKHFKSHTFQPGADGPWIQRMIDELNTNHHYIAFDTPELVDGARQCLVLARFAGDDRCGFITLFILPGDQKTGDRGYFRRSCGRNLRRLSLVPP
jgi:asparagine synthase (glutamine-hydrolysing)